MICYCKDCVAHRKKVEGRDNPFCGYGWVLEDCSDCSPVKSPYDLAQQHRIEQLKAGVNPWDPSPVNKTPPVKMRDESTPAGKKIWKDVDKAAARAPEWVSPWTITCPICCMPHVGKGDDKICYYCKEMDKSTHADTYCPECCRVKGTDYEGSCWECTYKKEVDKRIHTPLQTGFGTAVPDGTHGADIRRVDPETGFTKADVGKLRWDLLPLPALRGVVKVLMHGAKKYDDHNWQRGTSWETYWNAAMRHMDAFWWDDEDNDPDSGMSHLDHAMCCLLFLRWFTLHKKYEKFDGRSASSTSTKNE